MTQPVSAHTVARFPVAGDGFPIVIEGDPGVYSDGDVHLLISPVGTWDKIAVDVGAYRLGSIKPIDVPAGVLQFNGSNSASLPRIPVHSSPSFTLLFAFDGDTGDEITPAVTYNGVANQVALNADNVHGMVSYSAYVSRAQELIYTPVTENLGSGGIKVTYGVIAAFRKKPPSLTIYQTQFPTFEGIHDIEVYRKISYAVTTPDGEFEMPPGYPNSGAYTAPAASPDLDLSTHLRTERVHEIGKMRADGYCYVTEFNVTKLNPYIGNLNYTIPTSCRTATLDPDKYSRDIVLKAKDFIASRGLGCK